MPAMIDRSGAEALIPEDVSPEIIQEVPQASAVMQLGKRLPNMSRGQKRMPVLSGLITGGFVNGDTGLKPTGTAEWDNVFLNAGEIAVIVPIPEAVLDDADYDIWGQTKPQIVEEFGRIFDSAVLWGLNKPTDWPDDLLTQCAAASHTKDYSTAVGAGDDLYDIILGEGGVVSMVEEDGYMATGHVAALKLRAAMRGLRDTSGQPIFMRSLANGQNMQEKARYELDGEPVYFPKNGAVDPTRFLDITGDWSKLVWALRQDMTYKLLTEAVIQDQAGNIIYNLAQQDMVALRCVMRLAWALPNPPNRVNPNDATRFPFAALAP
ncbi:MAG: phage major capsid protein [Fimbriimonas sp.]